MRIRRILNIASCSVHRRRNFRTDRRAKFKSPSGFTLIELLTVIGIIGVLAAIGVQNYADLRMRGFDARAVTDLRAIANAEEAYFSDNQIYKSCATSGCSATLPGIAALSEGVTLQITATPSGFIGTASHPLGSGIVYQWDTAAGGLTN